MSMDPAAQQQKQLSSLATGDPLSGRVIGRHRQKLFLDVPVVRPAAEGREAPVQAYLSLPAWHELLQQPADGTTLDVFVRKVQAASGRLEVDLRAKPRAPRPASTERARVDMSSWQRLEDLELGDALDARVAVVRDFGAFVHTNVTRAGRGGERLPVIQALVPANQQPGYPTAPALEIGQQVSLRVLRPHPGAGKLLLTARSLDATALTSLLQEREATRKRSSRRPSLAALANKAGSEREGVVVRLTDAGAVVNVGARKPGLIHLSQFDPRGPSRGKFISHPSEVCSVGDTVRVRILPRSTAQRLSLRLLKVFPRSEEELQRQAAILRSDEQLAPEFTRAEDALMASSEGTRLSRADELEMDRAWAERDGAGGADDSEAEDPFAWAASASASEPDGGGMDAASKDDAEEGDDPWAWAAADAASDLPGAEEATDDGTKDEEDAEWGTDEYFDDKYDIDTY